jgi:AraC family transcriptional regulator of arabinose operon
VFAALGKSHTAVTKAFRKVLGTSVVATVANARIDEACRLLRDTDLDVERIASMSGFASVSYFMQAFKASKGTSSGAWRNSKNAVRTP